MIKIMDRFLIKLGNSDTKLIHTQLSSLCWFFYLFNNWHSSSSLNFYHICHTLQLHIRWAWLRGFNWYIILINNNLCFWIEKKLKLKKLNCHLEVPRPRRDKGNFYYDFTDLNFTNHILTKTKNLHKKVFFLC